MFYLNVVGYKGLIIKFERDGFVWFYLNVVGYKGGKLGRVEKTRKGFYLNVVGYKVVPHSKRSAAF